ncbi:hypothetical protein LTR85_003048 [Meristemomyces frigidus]|nr:hypothetical protein LTR85_003048 [Meristemomyces frigidus]
MGFFLPLNLPGLAVTFIAPERLAHLHCPADDALTAMDVAYILTNRRTQEEQLDRQHELADIVLIGNGIEADDRANRATTGDMSDVGCPVLDLHEVSGRLDMRAAARDDHSCGVVAPAYPACCVSISRPYISWILRNPQPTGRRYMGSTVTVGASLSLPTVANVFDPARAMEDYTPDEKTVSEAVQEVQQTSPADTKLLRKVDFRLIPILGAIYFILFLDQVNLANAASLGLEEDLNLPSNGFNTALWIFYIPLFFVEIPSNVVLTWRKIRPGYYIGTIIFLLGILSMCQGFTKTYGAVVIPNFPHEATFLTEDERNRLVDKLAIDRGNEKQDHEGISYISLLLDYKKWLIFGQFFCTIMTSASIASFSPTILTTLGWTAINAQLVEIPIWWCGIVAELATTYVRITVRGLIVPNLWQLVGKYNIRWPFIVVGNILVMIGWILNLCQVMPLGVRYFALYLMAVGGFSQCPILSSWMSSNLRGRVNRGVGTAMMIGYGNGVNLIASNVFISNQSPRFPVAFGTGLGMTLLGLALCIVTVIVFTVHNKRLDAKLAGMTAEDAELDDQVHYKLVL